MFWEPLNFMKDVLIIGAGINGLLQARELARSGLQVLLLDAGAAGGEASWAGGGIVSPLYPWRYSDAVSDLADWSQQEYPRLVQALKAETGIDPQCDNTGLLMLDPPEQQRAMSWANSRHKRFIRSDARFMYDKIPELAKGFKQGIWIPGVNAVRNPRLLKALRADLDSRPNVTILENCKALALKGSKSVTAVEVCRDGKCERLFAGSYVVCAGAWTSEFLGHFLDPAELPQVFPVKGQMLLFRFSAPWLSTIALYEGKYLVPRRDGCVLVGSTLEFDGFDKQTTVEGLESLHQAAEKIVPKLGQVAPVAQWAGLRPGSPTGTPYIGRVGSCSNLYLNAGQFRNGLLLAPASARMLSDCMLGRPPIINPEPYQPGRQRLIDEQAVVSPDLAS